MHEQAKNFTIYTKQKFSEYFEDHKIVLDVGSADINGNNKFLFSDPPDYSDEGIVKGSTHLNV